jgi:carbon monoxide dehydrogenase subunit G
MEFSNTVTIERPVHDVFRFVADLENVPRWNYAIVETRKTTAGPPGVGTTYRQLRSVPSRTEEILRITELEPNKRVEIHGEIGPFVGTLIYEFEELDGATRLTNSAELEARGIAKLASPIVSGRVRSAVAENLGVLKELLERA